MNPNVFGQTDKPLDLLKNNLRNRTLNLEDVDELKTHIEQNAQPKKYLSFLHDRTEKLNLFGYTAAYEKVMYVINKMKNVVLAKPKYLR